MEYMNYVDFPVDYFRGVPEINILIYETDIYGYKLKTSFSYHASDIQVQNKAGHFGTGWHLNAGGCISRKVVGSPDDKNEIVTNYSNKAISN